MGSSLRVATAASWLVTLGAGIAAGPARAQGRRRPSPPAARPAPAEQPVDIFDVARKLFKKTPPANPPDPDPQIDRSLQLSLAPGFGYKPSAGFIIGAPGISPSTSAIPRRPASRRPWSGASYSSKQQTSLTLSSGRRAAGTAGASTATTASSGPRRTATDWGPRRCRPIACTRSSPTSGSSIRRGTTCEERLRGRRVSLQLHTNVRPGDRGRPRVGRLRLRDLHRGERLRPGRAGVGGLRRGRDAGYPRQSDQRHRGWFASVAYQPSVKDLLGSMRPFRRRSLTCGRSSASRRTRVSGSRCGCRETWSGSGTAPYFDVPAIGMDT